LPPVARLADRRVLLALVVLVAVGCRAAGAGDRLSADEGYSWLVASAPDAHAFLDRLARYENTPPLFYLLLSPVPLRDEVWIRLPALLAGIAAVPVLYAIVRPLAGTRAALLAGLALAVGPYAVSYSNFGRAFTLATLGMLVALWGAARLAQGRDRRWWWVYGLGAVGALYSQYFAALFLVALVGALLVVRRPRRAEAAGLGLAPFLALLPWIHQIERSRHFAGFTKVDPSYPGPSPGTVRDLAVRLAFGEHGTAGAPGTRWLQALAVAAVLTAAVVLALRKRKLLVILIGASALGTVLLHAVVAPIGPDVFAPRYLTLLVPLAAALVGTGIDALPWRAAAPLAAAALVAGGIAVVVQRTGRELEPDYQEVRAHVPDRTVLTNSAVVAYYLRDLHPLLDRPFDLGQGREGRTAPPYVVVDDSRVGAGPRPGPGERAAVGPIVIRRVARAP
jgi:4-amino-4-deoxy-L-arabinose transferase-like glycosyltransferase